MTIIAIIASFLTGYFVKFFELDVRLVEYVRSQLK